jgi:hypothetical protein
MRRQPVALDRNIKPEENQMMKKMVLLISLLVLVPLFVNAQTSSITQCEWFTGTDPGMGNGNAISIGASGGSVGLSFSVATGSLLPGITRVKIRCRADSVRSGSTGVWGVPTDGFAIISPGNSMVRLNGATGYAIRVSCGQWNLDFG